MRYLLLKDKLGFYSLWVLALTMILSLFAEFWINNKPLLLVYNDKTYFPVLKDYHPESFEIFDQVVLDYMALDKAKMQFVVWPMVKWGPYQSDMDLDIFPAGPSKAHLLGTDDRGRDLLSRLVYGYRNTLLFAFSCLFVSYLIGIVVGSLMGFYGGWIDLIGMRLIEIIESIPTLFILLVLVSIFEPSIYKLALYLSLLSWVKIANQVRTQILKNKYQEFIQAARVMGMSDLQIVWKHLLPNSLGPVYTLAPFSLIGFVTMLSVVDFLGMGLPPPMASWGEIFQQAQAHFISAPWIFWFPALFMIGILSSLVRVSKLLAKI